MKFDITNSNINLEKKFEDQTTKRRETLPAWARSWARQVIPRICHAVKYGANKDGTELNLFCLDAVGRSNKSRGCGRKSGFTAELVTLAGNVPRNQ